LNRKGAKGAKKSIGSKHRSRKSLRFSGSLLSLWTPCNTSKLQRTKGDNYLFFYTKFLRVLGVSAVRLFPRNRPKNTLFTPFSFPEAYGMLRNGGYVELDSRPAQLKKVEFG
jgi:hypothetical protein